MRLSKLIFAAFFLCALQAVSFAEPLAPILPRQFAGWHITGSDQISKDPAVADPVNAALLNEYGFAAVELAVYTRDDGRQLTIRAARFADATGAYGAFTYYKQPEMLREEIPDQGSSWNERVLFYHSNILVDAVFQKLSAMSTAELRDLSGVLPLATGSAAELPAIPTYLPKQAYVKNSAKYVLGPVGLDKVGVPLSSDLVNFKDGAEVVLGKYNTSEGEATLVLISYPTPQIATDRLKAIDATHAGTSQPSNSQATFFDKRTGPLVAVVFGTSKANAQALLDSVNYDANVTWNQSVPSKKDNIGVVVVTALLLAGILGAFSLVFGIAFGGFRMLLKRVHSESMAFSQETEFISLNLEDKD